MKTKLTLAELDLTDSQKERFFDVERYAASIGQDVIIYIYAGTNKVSLITWQDKSRRDKSGMDYNYNTGEYHHCEHFDYLLIEPKPLVKLT